MANNRRLLHTRVRTWVQIAVTLVTNAYIPGFLEGRIYQGNLKSICVPGLNCYACPGALGSCPIGSLQASLGSPYGTVPWYAAGFLFLFGAAGGRWFCGWACPFGMLQDFLHRIPLPKQIKRLRRLPGERFLSALRYVVLAVMVILLPMVATDFIGQGKPWFCAWVCPSGTLSGLLLLAGNESLREAAGWLFAWKNAILAVTVLLSVVLWRPFCRYICPLGAVYGMFNPVALYRFRIDTETCTSCGACRTACKLDIPVYKNPNSSACVRCGDCIAACPHNSILSGVAVFKHPSASKSESDCPSSKPYPTESGQ